MRGSIAVALSLVALCSCGGDGIPTSDEDCARFHLRSDPELSPVWGSASAWASATWSTHVSLSDGRECTIDVVPDPPQGEHSGADFNGFRIRTDPTVTDPELARALMLHEMGHVLGLSHETDPQAASVMRPIMWRPARLGCRDVRRACERWGCTPPCHDDRWLP